MRSGGNPAVARYVDSLELIAFPSAGGGSSLFAGWADLLPDWVAVRPVRLPGRLDRLRERSFASMQPLVETLAAELAPALRGPFALFGHSMGALVAFELARKLRTRTEEKPVALFVASCGAPHLARRGPTLRHLPDDRFLAELRRLDGMPDHVEATDEMLELALPALRADISLCETYVCAREPPLPVRISAFVGSRDPLVKSGDVAAWRVHTSAGFELRVVPGGHFFSRRHTNVLIGAIASDLRASLGAGWPRSPAEARPITEWREASEPDRAGEG